jgi:hypothetical protein
METIVVRCNRFGFVISPVGHQIPAPQMARRLRTYAKSESGRWGGDDCTGIPRQAAMKDLLNAGRGHSVVNHHCCVPASISGKADLGSGILCGGLTPLSPSRDQVAGPQDNLSIAPRIRPTRSGVEPPRAKAASSRRTPKAFTKLYMGLTHARARNLSTSERDRSQTIFFRCEFVCSSATTFGRVLFE